MAAVSRDNATLIAWLTGRPTCPPFPLCGSRGNRASRDALEGGEDAPRGGRWIGYLDVRSLPEPDSSFLAGSCGCFTNRASKVEAGGQWRRAVVARVRHETGAGGPRTWTSSMRKAGLKDGYG